MNRDEQLTPHFKLSEFLRPQDPLPDPKIYLNLKRLAEKLEWLRARLGNKAIKIISGYRTVAHNKAVGGKLASYHLKGLAADITVSGMTPQEVQKEIDDEWPGGLGYGATFTHVDIRPYKARWHY